LSESSSGSFERGIRDIQDGKAMQTALYQIVDET
jgi:hypothetical protein